jgi:hypothetical protein
MKPFKSVAKKCLDRIKAVMPEIKSMNYVPETNALYIYYTSHGRTSARCCIKCPQEVDANSLVEFEHLVYMSVSMRTQGYFAESRFTTSH